MWWHTMNLDPWMTDGPQGAHEPTFAQGMAAERARRRGIRQRVSLNRGETFDAWRWVVVDVGSLR